MTFVKKQKSSKKEDLLVSAEGVEPSTNSLKGYCSAIELRAHLYKASHACHTCVTEPELIYFLITSVKSSGTYATSGKADCILSRENTEVNVIMENDRSSMCLEAIMTDVNYVTEADFQEEVIGSTLPVLVDFTATWCQPCKMIEPIVKQLAGEWEGKVKVVKLDADQNPNIMMQYGVMGIPTLMLFKGGEIKERMTGFQPKEKLAAKVTPHV
jgi:thioredoxin 1